MRIVVALGGNAIVPEAGAGWEAERGAARETAETMAPVLREHEVVLTHGNGPQVGRLMLQEEECGRGMPLDILVAETQAQIGYMLQQAVRNVSGEEFAALVTQVVVDRDDAAFDNPTKPVGPWYTAEEAREKDFPVKEVGQGEKAWRRVVPSPTPQRIVEAEHIQHAIADRDGVICCGGGGIPVVEAEGLEGVEAVIDKDRATALLAGQVDADRLVLLTNVPYAYRDFGEAGQEPIHDATAAEMQGLLGQGVFGEGSMQPKVEACISFVEETGNNAVIAAVEDAADAVEGEAGTRIRP